MGKWSVRIENIILENFKNVKYGEINLENKKSDYKASILGLYGQNGSGKTALIDAIAVLRYALSGKKIPVKYADYINIDSDYSHLQFQFQIKNEAALYHVWYDFSIKKDEIPEEDTLKSLDETINNYTNYKVTIYDEVLRFNYSDDNTKVRTETLLDTKNQTDFQPKAKLTDLFGANKETHTEAKVAYKVSQNDSRSFMFSKSLLDVINTNCKNERYLIIFNSLVNYGKKELFVINTENSGLISLNALPIAFKYRDNDENREAIGQLALPLNDSVLVPTEMVDMIRQLMTNMNIVLRAIIPGLEIEVHELNTELFKNAKEGKRLQLTSKRNGKEIPLKYESEGIKKIVSVLQLLIVVYNSDSITLAIDELDSGIFEYLLGEMLKVISEKGKGQLIFTSHNLRPLETIDKHFIAFTTVNPSKRFIRFINVKGNNNLRDFYFRDIMLGEQAEPVYETTNNYEIILAFKEAGRIYGA